MRRGDVEFGGEDGEGGEVDLGGEGGEEGGEGGEEDDEFFGAGAVDCVGGSLGEFGFGEGC